MSPKKEVYLTFRISKEELNQIKKRASEAKTTVSEYARNLVIEGKATVVIVIPEPNQRLWVKLAGIAANLNQIVHRINAHPKKLLTETQNLLKNVKTLKELVRKLRRDLIGKQNLDES